MGLSLADAAVRGNTSTTDIAEQKQSLLSAGDTEGLIRLNRTIFGGATMMAKEDDADDDADDEDDDDSDDEDDDEDDDGDDDEDEDDKGKKRKKVDPKDARIKEVSAEAKKYRLKAVSRGKRIAELEAENARLKGSTKKVKKDDDADDEDEESEETVAVKKENEALKQRLQTQTLRTEFNDVLTDPKQKIKFIDPKAAFRLLDLDDVEIDEDGDVEGMEDAIKDLAKRAPYLVVKPKKKGEDDEDEDDDEDEPPKRRTGQRTGTSRSRSKTPNRDVLVKKYGIKR